MLSKGAKRTILNHITEILQFCFDILHGVETCIGMIWVYLLWSFNVSASQTLRYKISLFEFLCLNCTEVFADTKSVSNKFNINVSSLLMFSLRAIVICQKYFGNHVISSQIHLLAPLNLFETLLVSANSSVQFKQREY